MLLRSIYHLSEVQDTLQTDADKLSLVVVNFLNSQFMVGIASMPWEQHAEMLFGKLVDIIIHHNSYVFYHFVTVRALVVDKTIL